MKKAFTHRDIDAVAFDIDGTLYPAPRLYRKLPLYFLKNMSFFLAFNKVRKILHKNLPENLPENNGGKSFHEIQANLMASEMGISPEEAGKKVKDIVYEGLKPFFLELKPFPCLQEIFSGLKKAGFKTGILSDFPPEQKGNIWGIGSYCDAVLSSEESGALKPSPTAFKFLSDKLDVPSDRILYVGNSLKSDIRGASAAGMKTALILSPFDIFNMKKKRACDIYFYSYRQFLTDVVNFE